MEIAILILFLLGLLLSLVGGIWGWIVAWQDGLVWGLLYLIPVMTLVFLVTRWTRPPIRKAFFLSLGGLGLALLASLLSLGTGLPMLTQEDSGENPAVTEAIAPAPSLSVPAPVTPPPVDPNVQYDYTQSMRVGYGASAQQDYQTALINFQRALQTRPGDPYASIAIENIYNQLHSEQGGQAGLAVAVRAGDRYSTLASLLQSQQWQAADQETARLMLQTANREGAGVLDETAINNLSCGIVLRLDHLWRQASNDQFGFGVQTSIWQDVGRPRGHTEDWEFFGDRVAWRRLDGGWIPHDRLTFEAPTTPGHLPSARSYLQNTAGMEPGNRQPKWPSGLFFQRMQACGLPAGAGQYGRLENLLQARRWKDASKETAYILSTTAGREAGIPLNPLFGGIVEPANIPCDMLRRLDQLWTQNSEGRYGFSVQKQIWQEMGRPILNLQSEASFEPWDAYRTRLGWPPMNLNDPAWDNWENRVIAVDTVPPGFLPLELTEGGRMFMRVEACGF